MRTFCDPYHPDRPPLGGWRKPRPGEPAHGFVVSLAEINRRASVSTMLITHALNGRHPQPDECLAFALSLPFEGRDALVHATPVVGDEGVSLLGQAVRRRQWQVDRRRFCPACLAEDAYHRTWWDLNDFRRCPYHGIDLVDRDQGGRPVPWWSPSFTRSPSGNPLARFGVPRRSRPTPSIETYILGRLGAETGAGVSLLDGLATLGEALDAARLLGRIALWGREDARPAGDDDGTQGIQEVMDAGHAVARRGERAVLALLHEVAAARAGTTAGRAKTSCFGWILEEIWREDRDSITVLFERLVDRVMVERRRGTAATGEVVPDGGAGWLPLPRLARELDMDVTLLRRVSQALGIHADPEKHARNRYLLLTAAEADLVRRTVTTLVDRDGAASALGLRRSLLDGLVAAHLLRPFSAIGHWRSKQHFRPEDVAAFAERALSGSILVSKVQDGFLRLATLERTHRRDPSGIVAGLLDEGPTPRMRTGPSMGDLLVPESPPRKVSARRSGGKARDGLSRYEAASLIGCQAGTVDALLAGGLIASATDDRRRLDARSVDDLRRRWAPAGIYREALRLKAGDRRTGWCLEGRGVAVRRLGVAGGYTAFLVERASARAVLGLGHDPDAPETGSTMAFEAAVLEASVGRGAFRRLGQDGCLSVIDRAGDLSLRVRLRRRERKVELDLLRYSAKGVALDGQVAFARMSADGRIDVRPEDGRLRATLRIPVPGIADPTAWPDLATRVVDGLALFREAFPPRRKAAAGRKATLTTTA